MQATQNKQSRFNIPGGGWITIEQDGDKLITSIEGRSAAFLAQHICAREMDFDQAVAYCQKCLMSEKESLHEFIAQQFDFIRFCQVRIAVTRNNDLKTRNDYEAMISTANWGIRQAEIRLKKISQ